MPPHIGPEILLPGSSVEYGAAMIMAPNGQSVAKVAACGSYLGYHWELHCGCAWVWVRVMGRAGGGTLWICGVGWDRGGILWVPWLSIAAFCPCGIYSPASADRLHIQGGRGQHV